MAKNAYFLLSTHIEQFLILIFCAMNGRIGGGTGQTGRTNRQVNVEIVMSAKLKKETAQIHKLNI